MRVLVAITLMTLAAMPSAASARSLRDRLSDMSDPRDVALVAGDVTVLPEGSVDFFGPAVQRLAIRGTDFPITSTVPGFSYVYNPDLQVIERSTQLGPVFVERTETVGRGRIEAGVSFLYASLDEVNGGDFGTAQAAFTRGDLGLLETLNVESMRLEHYWINTSFTYGITDRWDVNLLVPVVYTKLRARGVRKFTLFDSTGVIAASPFGEERRADGDALGAGDVLVRTKYRLVEGGPVNLAGALTVRVPSGEEDDFQGLGDTTVTPTAIVSAPVGSRLSLHGTLGFEVNADDLERTRARYTVGGSFQVIEQLALLVDVLGSSSFVEDEFDVPGLGTPVNGLDLVRFNTASQTTTVAVPQTNLVDLAAGVKVSLGPNAVFFVGAIVPLTEDGIRAEVIPTGGVEVGF